MSLPRFYFRRLLRLMPALLLMLVVVAPVDIAVQHSTPLSSIGSLFYFSDIWMAIDPSSRTLLGHTWSLSVEEQFYLVWPILLIICLHRRRLLIGLLFVAVLVAVVGTRLGLSHVGTNGVYYLPSTSLPAFIVGIGLAFISRNGVPHWRVWRIATAAPTAAAATCILAAAVYCLSRNDNWVFYGPLVVVALATGVVLAHALAEPDGPAARWLSSRPLVWLGERSYGFYLWHAPIAYYLFSRGWSPLAVGAVTLPLGLIATVLSWQLVEIRFNRLKDRRFSVRRGASPVSA